SRSSTRSPRRWASSCGIPISTAGSSSASSPRRPPSSYAMDTASNSSSGPSAAGCRCGRSSARGSTCRRPTVPRSSAGTRRCSSAACSAPTRASLAGRHPAADTSGAVRLVWDGRLDNRDELEAGADESDEAVVLRGYARWGDELPARLLGDFALALWDARRRRLLCARDRLGLKPFHYVWRQGVFRFASEAEPLLRALDGPAPDDEMVLALLLREFR